MHSTVEGFKIRLTGGLHIDRKNKRIELNAEPLVQKLIEAMDDAGYQFEWTDASIIIKNNALSEKTLAAVLEVVSEEPPPFMAQAAEEFECLISSRAFGRLIMLRNELCLPPETPEESLGAVKMLLTLDAIGAIDADTINDLLGG